FEKDSRASLREALIVSGETDAWRVIHGAGDARPGWYVEKLGEWLLSQGENELQPEQRAQLEQWLEERHLKGAYHKHWNRQVRKTSTDDASPKPLSASVTAPGSWTIHENGLTFELSFEEGYSIGLFLDQRDNRRRLITGHVAAGFPLPTPAKAPVTVLNTFAYTCGFSVAAAKAGAIVTSLDLSKKYLEWGRRNFVHNGLDPAQHDFIYGDAFDWMKRLARKGRKYSIVILDPPTFSNSKERGAFRVEKDYGELVSLAVGLLETDGCLLASTNAAGLEPEKFLSMVRAAVSGCSRKIKQEHYVPQPPDFPITREEPAYLKTVWMRIA
ncbi:MAG TPA: class I SAM-dependent rRNA methyltransferase, partial [Roseimicrobium sp.]|nr:class I SAM-dependent rRNA methyltransferase [Roseimicrobium sp.]